MINVKTKIIIIIIMETLFILLQQVQTTMINLAFTGSLPVAT